MKILLLIGLLLGVPSGHHGTVLQKVIEGGHAADDVYIVESDGQRFTVSADDLEPGDDVTVYTVGNMIVRTRYGWH